MNISRLEAPAEERTESVEVSADAVLKGLLEEAMPPRPVFAKASSRVNRRIWPPKSGLGDASEMQRVVTARQDNDLRSVATCLHRRCGGF